MRMEQVIEDADLGELVTGLEQLAQAMEDSDTEWDWDSVIDALEKAEGIENGIDSDIIENVVDGFSGEDDDGDEGSGDESGGEEGDDEP